MPDYGKELYEFYLLNMAQVNMPINKGWKDLSPEEKQAWDETARGFLKVNTGE